MILGVDPGLHGALVWLNMSGSIESIHDIPAIDGEVSAALMLGDPHIQALVLLTTTAIIEWPGIMPKNGAKTARSMGMSLATIHTFCVVKGITTYRVAPGVWKRRMGLSSDKEQSRAAAIRQWPKYEPEFRRKKDADRAEAALLAYYWLTKADGARIFPQPTEAPGADRT